MNYSFNHHAEKELEEIEKYYDEIRDELGDQCRLPEGRGLSRLRMESQVNSDPRAS